MNTPQKIPADVMRQAREHTKLYINPTRGADFEYSAHAVALAILAERERCAAWCEKVGYPDFAHDLRNPRP